MPQVVSRANRSRPWRNRYHGACGSTVPQERACRHCCPRLRSVLIRLAAETIGPRRVMHRWETQDEPRSCTCPRGPDPSDAAPNAAPSTHLPIVKTLENQFACRTLPIGTRIGPCLSQVWSTRNYPRLIHRHAILIGFFRFPIARATQWSCFTPASRSAPRSSAGSPPSRRRWAARRMPGWNRGAACAPRRSSCRRGPRAS